MMRYRLACNAPDCESVSCDHLQHPRFIRSRRDASDVHNPIGKTDHEQQIVGDQPSGCPDLHRQEVTGCQHLPVRLEKGRPRRSFGRAPVTARCRCASTRWQSSHGRPCGSGWPTLLEYACIPSPDSPAPCVRSERRSSARSLAAQARAGARNSHSEENRFQYAFSIFCRLFYGPAHPYNHLSIGRRHGLAAVKRQELLAFYQALSQPERTVYVVVGDISVDEVLTLFDRSAVTTPLVSDVARPVTPGMPVRTAAVTEVIPTEGQQTHIIWGFPAVTIRDHERYALRVLDTILGGMGGRLFVELHRDRKSLAYTVTSFDAYPVDPGFLLCTSAAALRRKRRLYVSSNAWCVRCNSKA